jgi:hypothetical protein
MSSTFSIDRNQLISLALRKLGVLEIGDTADDATLDNASLSLNLLIKQLSTEGLKLWKNTELVIPFTSSQTVYQLGGGSSAQMWDNYDPSKTLITDKPLKAIQAFYRNVSVTPYVDTPVMIISKQEYLTLGSKFTTGTANSIFYDPKVLYGILQIYLTPDISAQNNLQLHMVAQMPLNDIGNPSDMPDFPNEWMNCLVWNLADQLAIEYGVPMNYRQEIATRAQMYKSELTDWDVETSSTFFQPDYRSVTNNSYSR